VLTVVHAADGSNDDARGGGRSLLDEIVRDGARQMLALGFAPDPAASPKGGRVPEEVQVVLPQAIGSRSVRSGSKIPVDYLRLTGAFTLKDDYGLCRSPTTFGGE
jgi:hypothetical protein